MRVIGRNKRPSLLLGGISLDGNVAAQRGHIVYKLDEEAKKLNDLV